MTLGPTRAGAGAAPAGANPPADLQPELLSPILPSPVHLIATMIGGTLAAGVEIVHRGRTIMVVDGRVFDALGGRGR